VALARALEACAIPAKGHNLRFSGQLVIASELRFRYVVHQRPLMRRCAPRALALQGHLRLESFLVNQKTTLSCQFTRQLEWKTECVVQAKGIWARDDLRAEGRDLLELLHALLE